MIEDIIGNGIKTTTDFINNKEQLVIKGQMANNPVDQELGRGERKCIPNKKYLYLMPI